MASLQDKAVRGNAKLGFGGTPIGTTKEVVTSQTRANPNYQAAKTYQVEDDSDIAKQENTQGGYSQRNIDRSKMGAHDAALFEDQFGFDPGDSKNQGQNSRFKIKNLPFSQSRAMSSSSARREEKARTGEIDKSQGLTIAAHRAKNQQVNESRGSGGNIDTSQGVSTGVNRTKNQQVRERNAQEFTDSGGRARGNADTRDISQGQSVGELQRSHQESQGSKEADTGVTNPFTSHSPGELQANKQRRADVDKRASNDYYAGAEEQKNSILNDISGHDTFNFGSKEPEPETEELGATQQERSNNVIKKITSTSTFPLGTGGYGGGVDISAGLYGR